MKLWSFCGLPARWTELIVLVHIRQTCWYHPTQRAVFTWVRVGSLWCRQGERTTLLHCCMLNVSISHSDLLVSVWCLLNKVQHAHIFLFHTCIYSRLRSVNVIGSARALVCRLCSCFLFLLFSFCFVFRGFFLPHCLPLQLNPDTARVNVCMQKLTDVSDCVSRNLINCWAALLVNSSKHFLGNSSAPRHVYCFFFLN